MTASFLLRDKAIWVAGHNGMVGAALLRRLQRENCNILTVDRSALDLRRQEDVEVWMKKNRPDVVLLAAAHVGGIKANNESPADFLYDNLMIEANVIHAAHKTGVEKLLFLGSSCIYPRLAPQPISEEALLTGSLEPTNEWYAIAKIAGIKLCQAYRRQHGRDFISAMPCNLYGSGDRYDTDRSHVIPALIMKMHKAKTQHHPEVVLWGTGTPLREFLHVDDCADALVFLLQQYSGESHVNVGSGDEISIVALAQAVADAVGYEGDILFDSSMPDGTPRKLMDNSLLNRMGWRSRVALQDGLEESYADYLARLSAADRRAS